MDKKMTSGEIAKRAGVSQKAVRLYDEKGLLKPSEYTEGNYRLYDNEALLVLEKIIALKHIGYSLEEIRDNLIAEKEMDITESLKHQLEIMEEKKHEMERLIDCIKGVLIRSNGEPDWDNVAEVIRMIQMDQGADEHHFEALKHTADATDWYVKIYESLEIKEDARVLDLGCGYGKLWRNNWSSIPQNTMITGYDLHGSWADDFATYITENEKKLSGNTHISIEWKDVEAPESWCRRNEPQGYTNVIAHYLMGFLKDKELLIQRAAEALDAGGMFSCNGYEVSREHEFWKECLEAMRLDVGFISEQQKVQQKECEEFEKTLEKYFERVEPVTLSNKMKYDNPVELYERLYERYPEKKKYIAEHEKQIKEYFCELVEMKKEVIIDTSAQFWHCYK